MRECSVEGETVLLVKDDDRRVYGANTFTFTYVAR